MTTRHPAHTMLVAIIVSIAAVGCGKSAGLGTSTGGVSNRGGTTATGGSGQGSPATGGTPSTGGQPSIGGTTGAGGQPGTGGYLGAGASSSGGGIVASGGAVGTAGRSGTGGISAAGGGTGGLATGGSSTGTSTVTIDCNATLPSNGVQHSGNTQGTSGNLAWTLWSNGTGPTMTTFDTPAFRVTWGPKSGDVLARLGLDFSDSGLTYNQYGPITAQFAETKSGTGGDYSYLGIYGLSTAPCVEFYIVDDSYSAMPIKPSSTASKGTVTIDGGSYDLYSGTASAADASSCRGSLWYLFYSVRQTARTCGQISITQHFDAWNAAGMKLGNLAEVKILAEVGGGTGSIDFPLANVTIGP